MVKDWEKISPQSGLPALLIIRGRSQRTRGTLKSRSMTSTRRVLKMVQAISHKLFGKEVRKSGRQAPQMVKENGLQ
ncbi:hypothetical protein DPMN_156256 [Dreissena polymorpha]|uniref:Uncharacterized protein n=1 Tax=Dreissena polymorpha TaxID=45954 RepID=A0A9D4JBP0_DREPO|nr:hypothetical protein DPMN_156256 [Dreissena polymorpha]